MFSLTLHNIYIWQLGFLRKKQMNWTIKFSSKKFYSTHNFLGIWTKILMDCQSKETAAMKDKLGIDFHCIITFNFSQNEILYNWEILSSAHCWLSKWLTSIILNWECISIKRVIVVISLKLIIKCIMGEVIQFTAEVPFPSSFGQPVRCCIYFSY